MTMDVTIQKPQGTISSHKLSTIYLSRYFLKKMTLTMSFYNKSRVHRYYLCLFLILLEVHQRSLHGKIKVASHDLYICKTCP